MTIAYVYKWTHLPTMKWYIGSRTAKNCHPDDGYICSSTIVKPMIDANPHEWKRDIIATGMPDEMYDLETEILILFNARCDNRSFNKTNNKGLSRTNRTGMKHTEETIKKISEANRSRVFTEQHKARIGAKHKNKIVSEETKQKWRDNRPDTTGKNNPMFGKKHSDATKEKIRLKALKRWNIISLH